MKGLRDRSLIINALKLVLSVILLCILCNPSFARDSFDNNVFKGFISLPYPHKPGEKRGNKNYPTTEQSACAKELKSLRVLQMNRITGTPDLIIGQLTDASQEEPESIALDFFQKNKALWGMENPKLELSLKRSLCSGNGTLLHFQQMYKGIPVAATLKVNVNSEGIITTITGEYYSDIEVKNTPDISVEKAKDKAIQHHNENHFTKLDDGESNDKKTSFSAEPELLIWPTGDKDYLLWKLTTSTGWEYFIDAHDGIIKGAINPIRTDSWVGGNGFTLPNANFGPKVVNFSLLYDDIKYLFFDDVSTGSARIATYDAQGVFKADAWGFVTPPDPSDDPWIVVSDLFIFPNDIFLTNIWVSAHYYGGKAAEFYREVLGRDGYDPANPWRHMKIVTNCPVPIDMFSATHANGAYMPPPNDCIVLGNGAPLFLNIATALDFIAHEYSHGVTQFSSQLVYQDESGALNESFSDMMACAVEYWVAQNVSQFEDTFDWYFGEDLNYFPGDYERSLRHPPSRFQPDTYPADPQNSYLGYWHPYSDPSDAGGVHTNSGVPNKMFYLLSEGGIHNRIPVSGIGILNAAKLIYKTSTNYWNVTTNSFLEARNDCIAQAQNDPSMAGWADSVQNAWAAVGVGNPVDEPIPSGWTESGENIYRISGNVGIGTSNPAYKLDIAGTMNASVGIKINGLDVLTSESDPQVGTISTNFIPKWNGSQLITSKIFDNGNIGIDMSTPAYKLDVAGIINASGGIKINGQNVLTSESDPQVGTISTNFIPKWNGSQLITGRIFDGGSVVGIGTTSPVADLDVYDSGLSQVQIKSSGQNATLTLDSGVNYESGVEFKESNSRKWYMFNYGYGGDQLLLVDSYNYVRLAVGQNGNVGIGFMNPSYSLMVYGDIAYTGGCYDISDKRLKENIVPLTNAIEKISSINGIYFNNKPKPETSNGKDEMWSGKDKKTDKREVGVIAQEVEEVLPEVVTEDEEGYKAVDYSKFTPLLIEAVKELKKEIELLKTENQNLQNEILQIKEGNGTSSK